MALLITIYTDNAAFSDTTREMECARLLREVADKLDNGVTNCPIRDINGNEVGSFLFDETEG